MKGLWASRGLTSRLNLIGQPTSFQIKVAKYVGQGSMSVIGEDARISNESTRPFSSTASGGRSH